MSLPAKLQAMVDELVSVDDLTDKYEILIELGKGVPEIPASKQTPEHLVHGCQSIVHVYSELDAGGKLRFHGHADALIVNGLLALLVLGLDGLAPEEFLAIDPRFIEATGVIKTLTPSRVNGFFNIHQKMKGQAIQAMAQRG